MRELNILHLTIFFFFFFYFCFVKKKKNKYLSIFFTIFVLGSNFD
jgi:hypothetical protein